MTVHGDKVQLATGDRQDQRPSIVIVLFHEELLIVSSFFKPLLAPASYQDSLVQNQLK